MDLSTVIELYMKTVAREKDFPIEVIRSDSFYLKSNIERSKAETESIKKDFEDEES